MTDPAARLAPGAAAIFLFHGVVRRRREGVRNYTGKHLPVDEFVRFLDALSAAGTPVSLPEIAAACAGESELPDRAFAITFDDGFENNYSVAAPALADRRLPATFYVTSGFVDGNGASWIDLIEYAVERVAAFRLELPFAGPHRVYRTREQKIELLDAIRRFGKTKAVDPYELADEVWRQLGITRLEPDPDLDAKLSWEQVRELAGHELFTVGGHGLTHRVLEHLGDDELEREIGDSLTVLGARVEEPVEHFAYPEGLAGCYSDRVIDVLRRHGITCAATAEPGLNRVGDDPFRLRRFLVG